MTFSWKHPKYYKKNKNINNQGSEQADERTSEQDDNENKKKRNWGSVSVGNKKNLSSTS
jgi:hypothetical protein